MCLKLIIHAIPCSSEICICLDAKEPLFQTGGLLSEPSLRNVQTPYFTAMFSLPHRAHNRAVILSRKTKKGKVWGTSALILDPFFLLTPYLPEIIKDLPSLKLTVRP